MKFITLDTKDLYVNLPVSGIMHTTQFWLQKHNNHNKQLNDQILTILCTIIKQNYFQYEHQTYQQEKGIAMGSPTSSTIAEN
jgi:predicted lactoylglutathione lyase